MIKSKNLPSIRITSFCNEQMEKAIILINDFSVTPLTIQDFRRLSYLFLSRAVLNSKDLKSLNLKLEG